MGTPSKVDVVIGKLVGRYIILFGCVWDGNVYMYHHSEKLEKKHKPGDLEIDAYFLCSFLGVKTLRVNKKVSFLGGVLGCPAGT